MRASCGRAVPSARTAVAAAGSYRGQADRSPAKRVRLGLHKCGDCKKQFTVKVGTVLETSRVPLREWLQAVYLMTSSKKGVSAHQLHRALDVTYKTAWFMAHRIREAMRDGSLAPMGGNGGVVEVDETFIGHDKAIKPKGEKKGRGYAHKHKVLSLVERDTGQLARSMVVDDLKAATLVPILQANIDREATIYTDEASRYRQAVRASLRPMTSCATAPASTAAALSIRTRLRATFRSSSAA